MAAKEGKRGVGKIVLIVVVALVVIGAIGSMGGNGGANQAPAGDETQTSEQQPAEQTEPYTIPTSSSTPRTGLRSTSMVR